MVWAETATSDLDGIVSYIGRSSPRYAAVVVCRIILAFGRLADFPESGRSVPELANKSICEVIHGPYRIIYQMSAGAVEVITVFRASRLFPPMPR
ncbi:MAG: type II toxin-antitoxin system RelE/ParE family toxin [Gemmatimonas sp.]|nr:type II toxin-antitoxin system RelE/ParE family toxin [Gemmatimonas sp.]